MISSTGIEVLATSNVTRSDRLAQIKNTLAKYESQLSWSVDALIPADPIFKMPSASQAGVLSEYLPEVLLLRDDAAPRFFEVLELLPSQPPKFGIDCLEALGTKDFEIFSRLVAGAFFLNPKVNEILRYPGQQAIFESPDYDYIMEKIEPLVERGEIFTPV